MYKIVEKRDLNPTVSLMEIEAPMAARRARAGQFVIIIPDEKGERIPLTIADYDPRARHRDGDFSRWSAPARWTVDGKMKFTCVDGPEFDGHLVDFDEAIARSKIYEAQEQKVFERRHHYCNLQAMADAEEAAQKKEEK